MVNSDIPSGWYPDPQGLNCDRYWDGQEWTSQTRPSSNLHNMAPPSVKKAQTGLDSTEKALLIGIAVLILFVALFSTGY